MDRMCSIIWDVPQSELEQAFNDSKLTVLFSPMVYAAGTGMQLVLKLAATEGNKPRGIAILLSPGPYKCKEVEVAPRCVITQLRFSIAHQAATPRLLCEDSGTVPDKRRIGVTEAFKAHSIADLRPHLRDGHLKLGATFKVIH
jgi:hypothetical protein